MSKIRSKNTSLEKKVFLFLRKRGIYFRKHYNRVPGCPDIALPCKKKAVFVDGDFWHGYRFNSFKGRLSDYWEKKIENNIKRDIRNRSRLHRRGWKVLRMWQHDLEKNNEVSLQKIIDFIQN